MSQKILIVEDRAHQRKFLKLLFTKLSQELKDRYYLENFNVDTASCSSQAFKRLKSVVSENSYYDIAILDLSLPEEEGDEDEDPERGLEIVEYINKNGGVESIVIFSVFDTFEYVREAFIKGAVDFISKPKKGRDVLDVILRIWEKKKKEKKVEYSEKRLKALLSADNTRLADQFSRVISSQAGEILKQVDTMDHIFKDRFDIHRERDTDLKLVRSLVAIEKASKNSTGECRRLRESLLTIEHNFRTINLKDKFEEIKKFVNPFEITNKVSVNYRNIPDLSIKYFEEDFFFMLREMILGAIFVTDPYNSIELKVIVEHNKNLVSFNVTDYGPSLETSTYNKINNGVPITQNNRERDWKLSLVRYIAIKGGSRFKIFKGTKTGTTVILSISPFND